MRNYPRPNFYNEHSSKHRTEIVLISGENRCICRECSDCLMCGLLLLPDDSPFVPNSPHGLCKGCENLPDCYQCATKCRPSSSIEVGHEKFTAEYRRIAPDEIKRMWQVKRVEGSFKYIHPPIVVCSEGCRSVLERRIRRNIGRIILGEHCDREAKDRKSILTEEEEEWRTLVDKKNEICTICETSSHTMWKLKPEHIDFLNKRKLSDVKKVIVGCKCSAKKGCVELIGCSNVSLLRNLVMMYSGSLPAPSNARTLWLCASGLEQKERLIPFFYTRIT